MSTMNVIASQQYYIWEMFPGGSHKNSPFPGKDVDIWSFFFVEFGFCLFSSGSLDSPAYSCVYWLRPLVQHLRTCSLVLLLLSLLFGGGNFRGLVKIVKSRLTLCEFISWFFQGSFHHHCYCTSGGFLSKMSLLSFYLPFVSMLEWERNLDLFLFYKRKWSELKLEWNVTICHKLSQK